MKSIDEIRNELYSVTEEIDLEAKMVYEKLVKPYWEDEQLHGFPHCLYGFMMRCFAHIDLSSLYWKGNGGNQTRRMVDYLEQYEIAPDRVSANVALKMWRHSLMHTGAPRTVVNKKTRRSYKWLLHWSDEKLSAEARHFTFSGATDPRILNFALISLIADLRRASEQYLKDLARDRTLQENCAKAQNHLAEGPQPTG